MRVIDVRSPEAFAEARIPGSENLSTEAIAEMGFEYMPPSTEIVVVAAAGEAKRIAFSVARSSGPW